MSLMLAIDTWLPPGSPQSLPPLSLDALRQADPVLGFAVVLLLALLMGEGLNRLLRLPRMVGYMVVGALASPLALRLLERADLDPWKPLIDLAIGVLVFEVGTRIRPRWLVDNPWLALTCAFEGLLAGVLVAGALAWLGAPWVSAALAGAVAMSASPVISLALIHQLKPRGQVTERLLITTAFNAVLTMLAIKAWRVLAATGAPSWNDEIWIALSHAVFVVGGSTLLGLGMGWLLARLSPTLRGANLTPVLQIAMVVFAATLAAQWGLSPLLALMVAGMMARSRMGHALTVEPHLGSAGATLSVLMFISFGMLFTLDGLDTLWPWILAILAGRLVGKGLAVFAFARPGGLSARQALALTLSLQPMSSLAVLLATDTLALGAQLPGIDRTVLQALLVSTTLVHLFGPVLTQWALCSLAREATLPASSES